MAYGAAVAGWLAVMMSAVPGGPDVPAAHVGLHVRIRGGHAATLESTLRAAVARLQTPQCAATLDEFKDSGGRTLREGMRARNVTVGQHAAGILFYDGSHNAMCHERMTLAYTVPNSHAVLLCTQRLAVLSLRSPEWAEAIMIHELLHTLGLGENPPPSREITSRVIDRCRPS
jgi:hypothetical protein